MQSVAITSSFAGKHTQLGVVSGEHLAFIKHWGERANKPEGLFAAGFVLVASLLLSGCKRQRRIF